MSMSKKLHVGMDTVGAVLKASWKPHNIWLNLEEVLQVTIQGICC